MIGSFGKTRARSPFVIDEAGAIPTPGEVIPQPIPAGGILADAIAKKPGFFDGGGLGQTILNTAFEALTGVPTAAHREQAETRKLGVLQQQLQMQQQASMQEYRAKRDYDALNPAPFRFEANNGDQIQIGPDGQPRTLYKDPTPKTEWIQVKDPTTGILSVVPKPTGAAPAMPTAPVGRLTPIGGAGSGPRTFR